jgi:hypothetical protein
MDASPIAIDSLLGFGFAFPNDAAYDPVPRYSSEPQLRSWLAACHCCDIRYRPPLLATRRLLPALPPPGGCWRTPLRRSVPRLAVGSREWFGYRPLRRRTRLPLPPLRSPDPPHATPYTPGGSARSVRKLDLHRSARDHRQCTALSAIPLPNLRRNEAIRRIVELLIIVPPIRFRAYDWVWDTTRSCDLQVADSTSARRFDEGRVLPMH